MEGVIVKVARAGNGGTLGLILSDPVNSQAYVSKLSGAVNGLHTAVWRNHAELVQLLLDAGADPNVQDQESGWTALHRALHFGNLRIAALLLQVNASLTITDWQGRTPVDLLSHELSPLLSSEGPGEVYSWGNGNNYTLGTGSTGLALAPARIDPLHSQQVIALSAAKFHSVAVTSSGELLTWGWGHGGRLGHPEAHIHSGQSAVITPRVVVGLGKRNVLCVAAAKHHTLLCTTAGDVYTMGSNRYGQLGYPAVDTQPTPRRVANLAVRIVHVAAANKHSVAVSSAGEVYTWGSNELGQLGYGSSDSVSSANPRLVEAMKGKEVISAAAAKRHTIVLTANKELFTWGHRGISPRRIQLTGTRDSVTAPGRPLRFHRGHNDVIKPLVVAVCAGAAHSSALTTTGVVLTWRSADPELTVQEIGGGLAGKKVVNVAAGKYRTAAVTDEGDVYMWEGRADFFPADNRRAGSGSKKSNTGTPRAAAVGRMPIPGALFGASPRLGPHGVLKTGSYGDSVGSMGSSGRSRRGSYYMDKFERWQESRDREAAGGCVAGGSPTMQSSSVLKVGTVGKSPLSSNADVFKKIIPERVEGLKRVGAVAVGEKHSLALQRWSAVQLPGLAPVHWLNNQQQHDPINARHEEVDSQPGTPRSHSFNVDVGGDMLTSPLSSGTSIEHTPVSSPDKGFSSPDPMHSGMSSMRRKGGRGVPTLQSLCEAAVAKQLVDPRSALQVMEYADAAGADLLKAHCAAVALCNLDAVLLEAGGAFEELQPHILEDLEAVWKARLAGPWKDNNGGRATSANTTLTPYSSSSGAVGRGVGEQRAESTSSGAVVVGPSSSSNRQRSRVFLQAGRRPTAAAPYLGDGCAAAALLTAAEKGFVLGTEAVSLQSDSSFKDLTVLEEEQAVQRLRRNVDKKLQQIERLEQLQVSGAPLDDQQLAKIAQRPLLTAALAALDGGMLAEEVSEMLKAAAGQNTVSAEGGVGFKIQTSMKSGVSFAAATKPDQSRDKPVEKYKAPRPQSTGRVTAALNERQQQQQQQVGTPPGCPPPFSAQRIESRDIEATTEAAVSTFQSTPKKHVVGFSAGSETKSRPSRSSGSRPKPATPPVMRKGGLSMFLRGELDSDAPSSSGATGTGEQGDSGAFCSLPMPGGAWGGAAAQTTAPAVQASLVDIFQQQQDATSTPSTKGGKLPTTPTSATRPSTTSGLFAAAATVTTPTSTTGGTTGKKARLPLADFLSPSAPLTKSKPPAWGGAAATTTGAITGSTATATGSSPPSRALSLREIQEQQQEAARRQQAPSTAIRGQSPPSTSHLLARRLSSGVGLATNTNNTTTSSNIASGSISLLGTSPSASMGIYGSSPLGRPVFVPSQGPAQSKWYIPEGEERQFKSLADIQNEEQALAALTKQLAEEEAELNKVIAGIADAETAEKKKKNRKKKSNNKSKTESKPTSTATEAGGGSDSKPSSVPKTAKGETKDSGGGGGGDNAGNPPKKPKPRPRKKPSAPKADATVDTGGENANNTRPSQPTAPQQQQQQQQKRRPRPKPTKSKDGGAPPVASSTAEHVEGDTKPKPKPRQRPPRNAKGGGRGSNGNNNDDTVDNRGPRQEAKPKEVGQKVVLNE